VVVGEVEGAGLGASDGRDVVVGCELDEGASVGRTVTDGADVGRPVGDNVGATVGASVGGRSAGKEATTGASVGNKLGVGDKLGVVVTDASGAGASVSLLTRPFVALSSSSLVCVTIAGITTMARSKKTPAAIKIDRREEEDLSESLDKLFARLLPWSSACSSTSSMIHYYYYTLQYSRSSSIMMSLILNLSLFWCGGVRFSNPRCEEEEVMSYDIFWLRIVPMLLNADHSRVTHSFPSTQHFL
jgi:hypothetical protein